MKWMRQPAARLEAVSASRRVFPCAAPTCGDNQVRRVVAAAVESLATRQVEPRRRCQRKTTAAKASWANTRAPRGRRAVQHSLIP